MERSKGRANRGRKCLKRQRDESDDEDDQLLAASGIEIAGMSTEEKQQITKVLRLSKEATDDSENYSSLPNDNNSAGGQAEKFEVHGDTEHGGQCEVTAEVHIDAGDESDDTRPPSPDSPMFSPQHAGRKEENLNEEPWKKASKEFIDLNKTSDFFETVDDIDGDKPLPKNNHVHDNRNNVKNKNGGDDDDDDIFILSDRDIKSNVAKKHLTEEKDDVISVDVVYDGDSSGSDQWFNKSDKVKSSHRDNNKDDKVIKTKVASIGDEGKPCFKEKPSGKATNKFFKKSLASSRKPMVKNCEMAVENDVINDGDCETLSHSAVLTESDDRVADSKSDDGGEEEEDNKEQGDDDAYSAPTVLLARKRRLRLVQKHPYFSLSSSNCHDYTPVLVRLLKRYHQQVIEAQRHSTCIIAWGDSIKPGRHCSRTIDIKRRRGDSFCINPDEDADDILDELINDTGNNGVKCGSDDKKSTSQETKQCDIETDEKILTLKSHSRRKYAVINPCDKDGKNIVQEKSNSIHTASHSECGKYSVQDSDSASGDKKKLVNSSSPEYPDSFHDINTLDMNEETNVSNSALDSFEDVDRPKGNKNSIDSFLDTDIPVSSKILRSHQNKLNSVPIISSTNKGASASKPPKNPKYISKLLNDDVKQCVLDLLDRESQDSVNSMHSNKNDNNSKASVESIHSDKQHIPGPVSSIDTPENSEGFLPVNDAIFERAPSPIFTCNKEKFSVEDSPDEVSGDECSEIDIFSSQNTDYNQSKYKRLKLNISGNNSYLKNKTNSGKISFEQFKTKSAENNSGSSPKNLFSDLSPVHDDHKAFTGYTGGRSGEASPLLIDDEDEVLLDNGSDNHSAKYREKGHTSLSPATVDESSKENTSTVSKVANTIFESFKKLRSKATGKQTLRRDNSHESQSTSGSQDLFNTHSTESPSCSVQPNVTRKKRFLQTRKPQNRGCKPSTIMGLNQSDEEEDEPHISSVESLDLLDQDTQPGCGILCPLCNEEFSQDKIEQHASACLGPPFASVEESASHSLASQLLEKLPDEQILLSNVDDEEGSTKTCFVCDNVVDVEVFSEHMNKCIAASTKRQHQIDAESVEDKEDENDQRVNLRNRRKVHNLFSNVDESASRLQRQQPPRRKRAKLLTVDSPSDSSGTDFL